MYTIGICDDEIIFQEMIKEEVQRIFLKNNVSCKIKTYQEGKSMLKDISLLDIVLLDVNMPYLNGIKIKEKLSNENCSIIFISSHHEMIEQAFGKNVMGFVRKDELKKLEPKLEKIINQMQSKKRIYINKDLTHTDEIVYLKAEGAYTDVHLYNKEPSCVSKKLKDMSNELPMNIFIRVHKSYVVNLKYVKKYETEIILKNGETIPVSRTYKKEFKDKYIAYIRGR